MPLPRARASLALAALLAACGGEVTTAPTRDASPDVLSDAPALDAPALDASKPDASADVAPDVAVVPERPTYWAHVAPILQERCTQCHVAGGLGPFPLTTYAEARDHADLASAAVTAGTMPPWMPSNSCRPLQHVRTLSDADVTTLQRWAATGAAEGDRGSFVARPGAPEMLPAQPSLTVQPVESYTPHAERLDDYHCFVMDPALTESRDLVGVRFQPGEPRIVHHVIVYEIKTAALAALQRLDDAEAGPGYTCFGGPGIGAQRNIQFVAGWAPGGPPLRMPTGTGIRLSPGSRLVMQVHYNQANGRGLTDRTRTELFFSDAPVPRVAYVIPLAQTDFTVPAGARDTTVEASVRLRQYGVPLNATVYGLAPHMHTLGTAVSVDITRAGADASECLVDIPRWNFHWQQFYLFQDPVRVTPDDTIRLRCRYDNTAARQPVVDGVPQAPRDVHWGEGTFDEMCINFFYATVP
ncbi:MAG: monooxygenase [Polyangiales bacterium]